jgi:hypothetical protein
MKKEIPLGIRLVPVSVLLIAFVMWMVSIEPTIRTGVDANFSIYDGSSVKLVIEVKNQLNDPSSFQHIETRHNEDKALGVVLVAMKFRAKNTYGGLSIKYANAVMTTSGEVISVDYQ